MPFATNNKISTTEFPGAIEITDEEYKEALLALVNGQKVTLQKNKLFILSIEMRTVYSKEDKSILEIHQNEDIPSGYTDLVPLSTDHEWVNNSWVITPEKQTEIQRREIIENIENLESQQTARRIREATLEIDGGWLDDLESQISALRNQLSNLS